jgi:hypothetical protein
MYMKKTALILDTQVFVNLQLDFNHPQFERLEELKNNIEFQLSIPKMVELEVRKKLKEKLDEFHNTLSKNPSLFEYYQIAPCSHETAIKAANIAFDKFKEKHDVKVLEHDNVECSELVRLYSEQKAPFSSGKKNEFPDAISLLSIDSSRFKFKDIVSGDSDWQKYYADKENVSTFKSLPNYIDAKLREASDYITELKEKLLTPLNIIYLLKEIKEQSYDFDEFDIYLNRKLQNITQSDFTNIRVKEVNITEVKSEKYVTKNGYEFGEHERCNLDIQVAFDVYLELGRTEQIVNGESIDVPKLEIITLETNVSVWATLENRGIASFSLRGFYPTEWYLEH